VLLKLEQEGAVTSEWGASENNRRARFYRLTREGRKQLQAETKDWSKRHPIYLALVIKGAPLEKFEQRAPKGAPFYNAFIWAKATFQKRGSRRSGASFVQPPHFSQPDLWPRIISGYAGYPASEESLHIHGRV
jgi:Transcriptional regulator PadR-like family